MRGQCPAFWAGWPDHDQKHKTLPKHRRSLGRGRALLNPGCGAELREWGIGLHVIEQGIDTATMEGRAMFGMLSVLAELQCELIGASTNDGLVRAVPGPCGRARTQAVRAARRVHRQPGRDIPPLVATHLTETLIACRRQATDSSR
ncbi:hypothetical protein GCM10029978_074250 [Actinoallomurus acanthiterrae]